MGYFEIAVNVFYGNQFRGNERLLTKGITLVCTFRHQSRREYATGRNLVTQKKLAYRVIPNLSAVTTLIVLNLTHFKLTIV